MSANVLATPRPILQACARALAPRKPLTVSQWADLHRRLSSKGSAEPGRWRTDRNPPLREPMDCMSARSPVREVDLMFPIQFGKTAFEENVLGYIMDHSPGPAMVCLPGEVSMNKWVNQKLHPMLEETPVLRQALTSVASRDASNTRTFKDFAGGQLYLEHAGSPARLKSTTVKYLLVDELDEFAAALTTGDDPEELLDGRTSAFPATAKRAYVSTTTMLGVSRIHARYLKGDRRRYYVPCPHCEHEQPLEWSGLHWIKDATSGRPTACWYVCRDCGATIEEHHKTAMIAAGRWVPENPHAPAWRRSYTINGLYYQFGLGPRWLDLVEKWLDAQHDPAKLKTFVNDRLAEPWEDPAMRAVKHNVVADRAAPYKLRQPPAWVLVVTAGIDTQDDRWAVQLVGWGRGLRSAVLDYLELPGDPGDEKNWLALTELLTAPLTREDGAILRVEAWAMDAGGHRTQAVYAYVRSKPTRRGMAIFGAVPNNAPVLSKPKAQDIDWKGRADKRGISVHHVGTVAIKHHLFQMLSTDADKAPEDRQCHFSDELPPDYFSGLISETYNPAKNRFEKKRGARNEPLDTWVYAHAATHHPELRLHRKSRAEWDMLEARLAAGATAAHSSRASANSPAPDISAPPSALVGTPDARHDVSTALAQARLTSMLSARRMARHGR